MLGERKAGTLRPMSVLALTVGIILAAALSAMAAGASASTLCVEEVAEGKVTGPTTVGGSACNPGYEKVDLPSAAELETLNQVLPHVTYEAAGIDGKPTVELSGVNVQIVNGEGNTWNVNGEGNLVIGYDEYAGTQTGSHDLILGDAGTFTSYGGILAGFGNKISAPYAAVIAGQDNHATAYAASVTGGEENVASAQETSVSGGGSNEATGPYAWVGGGEVNKATGSGGGAAISGGTYNTASGAASSISGGTHNTAGGSLASVAGGYENKAKADYSTILGGKLVEATVEYEAKL